MFGMKCDDTQVEQVADNLEHGFSIDTDLPALQGALRAHPDVRLVIIDPLANHLGDANLNREQEARRVLTPLATVARDYNIAVIVVTHFNKAMSVDTLHKVGGAVAVIGVVRVAWAFVKNPENSEERMMLLNMKANISNGARGMSYAIESKEIEDQGKPIHAAIVKWGGTTTVNLEETMEMNSEDKKSARAAKWLRTFMDDEEQYARDFYRGAKLCSSTNTRSVALIRSWAAKSLSRLQPEARISSEIAPPWPVPRPKGP
jgi:hypothetical protein